MARGRKKLADPTEQALAAIQQALRLKAHEPSFEVELNDVKQASAPTAHLSSPIFWWLELFLLQLAFGGGMVAIWLGGVREPEGFWRIALFGMGALVVGFGAGFFLHRRERNAEEAELEAHYASLSARAEALVADVDRMITRTTSLSRREAP